MPFLTADTSASVWRQNSNGVVQQDGNRALYRKLVHYAAGKAVPGSVVYVGTGNGTIDDIDGGISAPTETWTITFTDATNFTVSGSVSGAQSAGSTGSNYTTTGDALTSLISFRIEVGGTPFVVSDAWTIPVVIGPLAGAAAERHVIDRYSPFTTAGGGFNAIFDESTAGTSGALVWHGTGSGSEAWYSGISMQEVPASQQWNFKLRGYKGFSPTANWNNQNDPSEVVFTALWNNDMEYWFVVNARRIVAVWDVSATMHSCYLGAILPFASPNEYQYPMWVAGDREIIVAWNDQNASHHHGIWFAAADNSWLQDTGGAWIDAAGFDLVNWPAAENWLNNMENMPSGDNQLLPISLYNPEVDTSNPLSNQAWGVADGCYFVTGFNITPQTLLSIGGTDYLVVNDVFRLQRDNFWALRLS